MSSLANRLDLGDDDIKRQAKLQRLCRDLGDKIVTPLGIVVDWRWLETDAAALDVLVADCRRWANFTPRTVWSRKQANTWFAATVTVPPAAEGRTVLLRFTSQWQDRPGTTDPQCLAYLDGRAAQAIDGNHTDLLVARDAVVGATSTVHVNAFTFFDRPLVGFHAEYCMRIERIERLYYDLQTPLEVACLLPQNDARRHVLLNLVEEALYAVDRRGTPDDASLAAAEAIAARIYATTDSEAKPTVTAVGHTHLDVGWLWRVTHTRDKTGRSFATVLALMAEYPGFVFMYNQAVLFNFLKKDYPEIWKGVKARVQAGQFEIEGAMWVEPDANIVSGESLVRQIMRGRRFHREEFGVLPKSVWLPDTFGYSANLPQIMARSGLEHFVTSKLSWNDTNRHPFDSFFWRGIDGTEVKAQLLTAQKFDSDAIFTTYNSDLSVSDVMGAWRRYEPKAVNDEILVCYGFGDGGGGPTRAMIERGERMQRGIAGAPRLRLEGIGPFLARLGEKMDAAPHRFPAWNGELYLEYHRGTLTSVARNKANNRRAERELRQLELLASLAALFGGAATYPSPDLDRYWETVLINQFHDILPGTSIAEVYADSDVEYDALFSELASTNGPVNAALAALPGAGLRLINTTSHSRNALVAIPGAHAGQALEIGGTVVALQEITGADGETALAAPVTPLPSLGWIGAALRDADPPTAMTGLSVSSRHLENRFLRVGLDDNGEIDSVFDKSTHRELIAKGKTANRLVAFEDKPLNWDAWDLDRYFEENAWPLSLEWARIDVVETGPHRAALRIERRYNKSSIVQVVSLDDGSRQLTFDTFVEWQERQTVLKAIFPFDLNVSEVRSEIQFGHVRRATHRNTSWDCARFEASMHRWVDISEPDFGAALLNDCKYGYDAVEQTLRLTLLRGPTHPNRAADLGEHRMRYALFVHAGAGDLEQVHIAAEAFNNPVLVTGGRTAPAPEAFSFASIDSDCVTIETVKRAEAGDGIVLRVFEHANRRARAIIRFGVPIASAATTNLMEEGRTPIVVTDNAVTLELRPFEIATLVVEAAHG